MKYKAIKISAKSDEEFAKKLKGLKVIGILRVKDHGNELETDYTILVKK
jgi:hypothetical protein